MRDPLEVGHCLGVVQRCLDVLLVAIKKAGDNGILFVDLLLVQITLLGDARHLSLELSEHRIDARPVKVRL
jgi:hypothetical protein